MSDTLFSNKRRSDAETMAKAQKEISVSELFAKNRHLLGFDNSRKALLTSVKKAVDNSLELAKRWGFCRKFGCISNSPARTAIKSPSRITGRGSLKSRFRLSSASSFTGRSFTGLQTLLLFSFFYAQERFLCAPNKVGDQSTGPLFHKKGSFNKKETLQ